MADKWIQEADLKEGAFTRKAKAAGMTVQEYAKHVTAEGSKADPKTKKQAVLAKAFKRMANRRGGGMMSRKDRMTHQ